MTTTAEAAATMVGSSRASDWAIFLIVYAGIAIGTIPFTRLNRSAIAMLGAIGVVALNRMSFHEATEVIDWATLALLFALMTVAGNLRISGFYTRVIQLIVEAARKPWVLLLSIIGASAVLSALFANDIVCLAFAPVLCVGLQRAGRKPLPYLTALATSSNIGSAGTIIGNPQNMLIGQTAHLSFANFFLTCAPVIVVALAVNVGIVAVIYRRDVFGPPAVGEGDGQELKPEDFPPLQMWQVIKTLLITAGLVGVFLFTSVPREIAALVAAGLVLISRTRDSKRVFAEVDWNLILLFIGLFVVIGNVQAHGLIGGVLEDVKKSGISLYSPGPFAVVTLVLSNIVSNVPAVLLLKPGLAIPNSPADVVTHAWYLLAVVSTFAGNLTLLGSIANLIVAEQAKSCGVKMTFLEHLKVGIPLTLVTVGLAVAYFVWVV